MIMLPPSTNEVALLHMQVLNLTANNSYLSGQVSRLQTELDFMTKGLLIVFSFAGLFCAALLIERAKRLRMSNQMTSERKTEEFGTVKKTETR